MTPNETVYEQKSRKKSRVFVITCTIQLMQHYDSCRNKAHIHSKDNEALMELMRKLRDKKMQKRKNLDSNFICVSHKYCNEAM